ncbi:gamma-glutamylcyclotransferase [uncultured Algibacter sp.]|uniref:gamma-glutamylcyclotransferase family protein n=1 Tax=uncultured Algibacter sp. TaxID=298659 RepID=UPI002617C250|nr:gamma-glutamylcyclotransferase family protein [uncultured Algibacter sp.]
MNSDYLFVYGTLLEDTEHEMSKCLSAYASYEARGYFQGKLYRVSWFPGAIISDSSLDKVYGKLYKLSAINSLFEVLDEYEGVRENSPKPNLFKREQITISVENSLTVIKAWVYLYNHSVDGLKQIPSGNFLKNT